MTTFFEALKLGERELSPLVYSNPQMESLWILKALMPKRNKVKPIDLLTMSRQRIDPSTFQKFKRTLAQRLEGRPLAYLLGTQEFMGLLFHVDQNTLIPRQETEIIVEETLKQISSQERPFIVDIGTGCGNIAISIANMAPRAKMIAIDISSKALLIAIKNAKYHRVHPRVKFFQGDVLSLIKNKMMPKSGVNIIVSNPPYIPTSSLKSLQKEIHYEPPTALDGGTDGLCVIRQLVTESRHLLRKGGKLILEIGFGQSEKVLDMMRSNGYLNCVATKDYLGIDRVVIGQSNG